MNVRVLMIVLLPAASGILRDEGPSGVDRLVTAQIERRIVKRFDFDEKQNFTPMPTNWVRIGRSGFLKSSESTFDKEIGFPRPPSFKLSFERGGIGTWYRAKDISIHPASDYRITARIRPQRLTVAGAYVTAFFLDHAFRKIADSERRSPPVRGAGADEPWAEVTVELAGGFENARWIGLSCMIEQPPTPQPSPEQPRPIHRRDVRGTAWFDDITVFRLPRASLELHSPGVVMSGNVFADHERTLVRARVTDPIRDDIRAAITIFDVLGAKSAEYAVPVVDVDGPATEFDVTDLPAGRYTVVLTAKVADVELIREELVFLRLVPDFDRGSSARAGFGVVLDAGAWTQPRVTERLLGLLAPSAVKIPLWHSRFTDQDIVWGRRAGDAIVRVLKKSGATIVATLADPPSSLARSHNGDDRGLIDILASDPGPWRPYLNLVLARYGARVDAWQLGDDGQDNLLHPDLDAALRNVHAEMTPLIPSPSLVVPTVSSRAVNVGSNAAGLSITVPSHVSATGLPDLLGPFVRSGVEPFWATIETLAPGKYDRRAKLAEFVRRLITARAAGVRTVFVRQPWTVDPAGRRGVVPSEEFAVLRSLGQLLRGMPVVEEVWIEHGVKAYLFLDPDATSAALAVWTEGDEPTPRTVTATIGTDAQRNDPWGASQSVRSTAGVSEFEVDVMPAVIAPVVPWQVRMQAGFGLDRPSLIPALQRQERSIRLTNTRPTRLRGTLSLVAPPGWRLAPRRFQIDLEPGEILDAPLDVRVPTNFPVGARVLVARLELDELPRRELRLRAPIFVESPGLDVNVMSHVADGDLEIIQRVTNRSDETMRLRAFVIAPDRPRDARLISALRPGQTTIHEYHVPRAAELAGQALRVSVEQLDGPAVHNHVIRFD